MCVSCFPPPPEWGRNSSFLSTCARAGRFPSLTLVASSEPRAMPSRTSGTVTRSPEDHYESSTTMTVPEGVTGSLSSSSSPSAAAATLPPHRPVNYQPPAPTTTTGVYPHPSSSSSTGLYSYTYELSHYLTSTFAPSVVPQPDEYLAKESARVYLEQLADRVSPGAKMLPFGSVGTQFD